MTDRQRETMQQKLLLQKTKNLMAQVDGVKILQYDEQGIPDDSTLRSIGFYSSEKIPEAKIAMQSDENAIVDWIISLLDSENVRTGDICCLWDGAFLVKMEILDMRAAVSSLWQCLRANHKSLVLITSDGETMLDFGSDSRDEYNILFDKYTLCRRCGA